MVTIPIRTRLSDQGANQALTELLSRMENPKGFYASVGERLLATSRESFRQETAPDGTAWAPLKPATIKAREKAGQTPITILRSNSKGKSGSTLSGSLSYEADTDQVRIGSPLAHAAIHLFGGTIKIPERQGQVHHGSGGGQAGRRFARKDEADQTTDITIPAHQIRIPARPYVGLSPGDEAGILEDARDWLTR